MAVKTMQREMLQRLNEVETQHGVKIPDPLPEARRLKNRSPELAKTKHSSFQGFTMRTVPEWVFYCGIIAEFTSATELAEANRI